MKLIESDYLLQAGVGGLRGSEAFRDNEKGGDDRQRYQAEHKLANASSDDASYPYGLHAHVFCLPVPE